MERALAEQVAGRVAADVPGVRGQVEELAPPRRTRSRPARPTSRRPRAGCRPAIGRAGRRAGPAPSAATRLADRRRGGAGRRLIPGRGPGSRPPRGSRARAEHDLGVPPKNDWGERRRGSASGGPEATSSSTIDADASSPSLTRVREMSARPAGPDGPADDDRPLERGRRPARGRAAPRGSRSRGRQLGELVVVGQRRRALEQRPRERPSGSRSRAVAKVSRITPAAAASGDRASARDPVLAQLDQAATFLRGPWPAAAGAGLRCGRTAGPPSRSAGAQVDVRRVQPVGLDRQRVDRPRARRAGRRAASRARRSASQRLDEAAIGTGTRVGRSVGETAGRSRSARLRRRRRFGDLVIRATPPSRASRGG